VAETKSILLTLKTMLKIDFLYFTSLSFANRRMTSPLKPRGEYKVTPRQSPGELFYEKLSVSLIRS